MTIAEQTRPRSKRNPTLARGREPGTPAERYERLYPETGCTEAQKQERMERMDFKAEAATRRRTTRNRGIIVPALPASMQKEEDR